MNRQKRGRQTFNILQTGGHARRLVLRSPKQNQKEECGPARRSSDVGGFTLIELLIIIAVLGILSLLVLNAVNSSRNKAYDARIRNDITQTRWLAESVYDTQGASYLNWSQNATIQQQLSVIRADVDKNSGDAAGAPYVLVVRESQNGFYCVSAPLRSQPGKHYCVDSTGVFKTTNAQCPNYTITDPALACP